jgi:hypothetical protein
MILPLSIASHYDCLEYRLILFEHLAYHLLIDYAVAPPLIALPILPFQLNFKP